MTHVGSTRDHAAGDTPGRGHAPQTGHHRRHRFGGPADPYERERTEVLGEVTTEGITALARTLRRAAQGDEVAAGIRAAALVRALPDLSMLDDYDILARAHVRGARLAGDLDPGERVELVRTATRLRRSRLDLAARAS